MPKKMLLLLFRHLLLPGKEFPRRIGDIYADENQCTTDVGHHRHRLAEEHCRDDHGEERAKVVVVGGRHGTEFLDDDAVEEEAAARSDETEEEQIAQYIEISMAKSGKAARRSAAHSRTLCG